jgi:hypothetical protein
LTERRGWARKPIQRIEVSAPAAPSTPINARPIADRRSSAVGIGNSFAVSVPDIDVEFAISYSGSIGVEEEKEKNEVGRAIRTTPRREKREAN